MRYQRHGREGRVPPVSTCAVVALAYPTITESGANVVPACEALLIREVEDESVDRRLTGTQVGSVVPRDRVESQRACVSPSVPKSE